MAALVVKPVENRRERRQFLELPWRLYRDDPNWIPPLRTNQRELVGYKRHPFYEENEVQTFIASRDGRVCGRLAAIVNHAHNRRYHEQRGFFGFFESIDDQAVASGLFDAARDWLAGRGMHHMRGPTNPSLNYECGLLVEAIEGFDNPPTFMMTYNPLYYGRLIETYGFRKCQDLYAYWGHARMLDTLDDKLGFIIQEATRRFHITARRIDKSRFTEEVRTFLDIYNQALVATWGFVPLSEGEIKHLAASLRHLIVPDITTIAEVDGRPIAACFGLLDYNPIIKQIDGRLFPFGFIKLLTGRKHLKRVRLISTNVLPEYQRWGVGLVLLERLRPEVLAWGVEEAEFSWVLESNDLSWRTLAKGGAIRTKTYRIYDYPAAEPAEGGE